ncbi:MAG: molecular chaperone [Rhizobiaceae bacterium]|nr:molecular chaperone [Rhizobiaceae bacterium]
MSRIVAALGALAILGAGIISACAASISVSPTTISLIAPAAASQVVLRNGAKEPVYVQIRVFKWSQVDGVEKLERTKAVVASPPTVKLSPDDEYVVRVVRLSKTPVRGEESYRLFVDELPQKLETRPNKINLVVRQSIPIFFTEDHAAEPKVAWSLSRAEGRTVLTGRNSGSMRLKITDLVLSSGGKPILKTNGLVGYVLGGSAMSFPLPGKVPTGTLDLSADSNMGKIKSSASLRGK